MHRTLSIFAVCTLLLLSSCGGTPDVVGSWKIDSSSVEDLSEMEKDIILTFKADGVLTQTMAGETREAKWEWVEKGKSLKMGRENKMDDIVVDELTEEKLIFHRKDKEGDTVTFFRQK